MKTGNILVIDDDAEIREIVQVLLSSEGYTVETVADGMQALTMLTEKTFLPDVIILDPPRDGIHPKALPKILSYGVDHIVYISCKATSLARDLPAFLAAGYKLEKACCVDQFCQTVHVETVVLLSQLKQKPDD